LEHSLHEIKESVDAEAEHRDATKQMMTSRRGALLELKRSSFEPLKAGSWETPQLLKLSNGLKKLFKQVEFDNHAVKTITDVLKKKPEERAPFDVVLVQQLELAIDKRLDEFEQESTNVSSTDVLESYESVRDAVVAAESAQDVLEKLRGKQHMGLQAAVFAEKRSKQQQLALEEESSIATQMQEVETKAEASQKEEQAALEQLQKSRGSLAVLRERGDPATLGA